MKQIDLVGIRSRFFLISGLAIVVSLVLLAIPPALRPGIEFTSGTTMLVQFEQSVRQEDLRSVLTDLGHAEARIQSTSGSVEYLIRMRELEVPPGSFTEVAPEQTVTPIGPTPVEPIATLKLGAADGSGEVALRRPSGNDACTFGDVVGRFSYGTEGELIEPISCADTTVYRVIVDGTSGYVRSEDVHDVERIQPEFSVTEDAGERTVIEQRLSDEFGPFRVKEFASVSPTVSSVAVRNAAIAVVVASIFIMGYVAFAFASVPQPFRYAACAIFALAHDVIITLGVFSLLGKFFNIEVNLMFVTGLLTVIGFSVHDSIVVFDRIRENVRAYPAAALKENVNSALVQTMARSFNTSLTLLLTAAAMLVLGGATIQSFLLVIVVGVMVGTYSSVAIAAQLLVSWDEGDFRRLLRRQPPEAAKAS
ncbi:MAG: protein translocase subunit SecF [Dehalococcoidia bacterium]|nr:protein translocase subunit SecF [Dehalococcoidia bacterium]